MVDFMHGGGYVRCGTLRPLLIWDGDAWRGQAPGEHPDGEAADACHYIYEAFRAEPAPLHFDVWGSKSDDFSFPDSWLDCEAIDKVERENLEAGFHEVTEIFHEVEDDRPSRVRRGADDTVNFYFEVDPGCTTTGPGEGRATRVFHARVDASNAAALIRDHVCMRVGSYTLDANKCTRLIDSASHLLTTNEQV